MFELELLSTPVSIDSQVLILLLMSPIIVTIIGIAKHVIGVKSLSLYAPMFITFGLYGLGLNEEGTYSDVLVGIKYGLTFIISVIVATTITAQLLKKLRMHYFPKIAVIISITSIVILITIIIASLLGRQGFSSVNAVALVLLVSVAEQFSSIMFKKNLKTAIMLSIETILISLVCYILAAWQDFQLFVLQYPYIVFVTLVINILIGRYKGLRFREYIRFKEVLKGASPKPKNPEMETNTPKPEDIKEDTTEKKEEKK
jgi:hypothetical protein